MNIRVKIMFLTIMLAMGSLFPISVKADEYEVTGVLIGPSNRGYVVFSDGADAWCIEQDKNPVDDDAVYVRDDSIDGSAYGSVFVAIAKADAKGMDHDAIRHTAQLAIWDMQSHNNVFRRSVKYYFRDDYVELFDEMESGCTEGYEVITWGYRPITETAGVPYQTCISGCARCVETEPTSEADTVLEIPRVTEEEKSDFETEIYTNDKECEHSWDDGVVTRESNCSYAGEIIFTCENCGETRSEEIPARSHDYEWVVTTEATTEHDGLKEKECKNCGHVDESEVIPRIEPEVCSHPAPRRSVVVKPGTCCSREVVNIYCNQCGELVTENGLRNYNPNNHIDFTERITKQATYNEEGEREYTCTGCGYKYTEPIPKLTCLHKQIQIYTNPADGKRYEQCVTCKKLLRESTAPITVSCSHSGYGTKEVAVAKADSTHWGEYRYVCEHCGEVIRTEKVHPYDSYTIKDQNGKTVTLYGYFDNEYAQEVYGMTNDYRAANGLNKLNYNSALQSASNTRALEAAVYFSHTRPDGSKWNTVTSSWQYGGENIASGQISPQRVMNAWKNSEGHNRNLLYGIENGQIPFKGLSVGCFHKYVFNNSHKPSVPTEILVWSQNFTFK